MQSDRRGSGDHRGAIAPVIQPHLRQAEFACARQFGPGIGFLRFGFDIILHGFGADNGIHRAIKPAGKALFPIIIADVVEPERRIGKRETVGGQFAIGIEHPHPQPLFLADLHQQRVLTFTRSARQRLGGDLRFDPGEFEAFVDKLRAVAIQIEQPAAHDQQRQDVDDQNARRQRKPPVRRQLFAARWPPHYVSHR